MNYYSIKYALLFKFTVYTTCILNISVCSFYGLRKREAALVLLLVGSSDSEETNDENEESIMYTQSLIAATAVNVSLQALVRTKRR